MPRYYFDVCDEFGWHRDDHGLDLESFEEARDQAIALLPDIARDELPDGEKHDISCEIRNARDQVIYRGTLYFRGEYVAEAGDR